MNGQSHSLKVLVTGGSGFVAGWIIVGLLKRGYDVRTSLRSLSRLDAVQECVANQGADTHRLTFCQADLTSDSGWDHAVDGCAYVIHTASPITQNTQNGEDLIGPARDGTLRVLRAAERAQVERVVLTSSLNAAQRPLAGAKEYITDENQWTDTEEPGMSEYQRSKTLAERAAWEFITHSSSGMSLTSILPGMIIGPVMEHSAHGSVELIQRMLNGRMPLIPNLGYIISDVRDLVDLHIAAMTNPLAENQRYAAAGDYLHLTEMAKILRQHCGNRFASIPSRKMPDLLLRLAALMSKEARFVAPMLGQRIEADTTKAQEHFAWKPRSSAQAIIDCADSLILKKLV